MSMPTLDTAIKANPILTAHFGAVGPVDLEANIDMLNALGGPGPEFDFNLWEGASDESRVYASIADEDEENLDRYMAEARRVLIELIEGAGALAASR